jgi:hypothetical protein
MFMKFNNTKPCKLQIPGIAMTVMWLAASLAGLSCETVDDITSRVACSSYCDKKAACDGEELSKDEEDACENSCRDSIENNCGNEHQGAANDKINECVDKACGEFLTCMVFEAAPECFGFASH